MFIELLWLLFENILISLVLMIVRLVIVKLWYLYYIHADKPTSIASLHLPQVHVVKGTRQKLSRT